MRLALPLVPFLVVACGESGPGAPAASTESIVANSPTPAEEFRAIGEALYAGDDPQYGRELRRALEARLAARAEDDRIDPFEVVRLAAEELKAGDVDRAVERLEALLVEIDRRELAGKRRRIVRALAEARLRQAENENCLARHVASCCILPARPGALHAERRPAERALELYRWLLEKSPDDLAARWLVNLTSVLLGGSPEDLPASERLPGAQFAQVSDDPPFRDVAPEAGLARSSLAGGVAVEDFDGDGWLDVVTTTCDPLGAMTYARNRGDGTFEDLSGPSGVTEQLGGLNLIAGDVDADGDQDLLVLRGGWLQSRGVIRNSLLRNDEGRVFVDVTRAAGLAEPHPTQTAVFADLDADGTLDLYVGNESRLTVADPDEPDADQPSQLFLNDGEGVFRDVAGQAGVTNDRFAKGVCAGDYDADGDVDLYVSNIGYNRLYRNDGAARFEDVAVAAGVLEPSGRSFACWFFDQDEDGRLDLWVNGYASTIADLAADALGQPHRGERPCLYRNQGDGTFVDVAVSLGLDHPWMPMGANFGDPDGDGWLDVYLGTGDPILTSLMPNVFLHNVAGRAFEDRTAALGLGHLQKGHGVAFADLDGDGDQDLFHKLGGFVPVDTYPNVLFQNRLELETHHLVLSLEGTRSNRDAVGAQVIVRLTTPRGPRTLHRFPGAVSSFGGSPHRLEIGLGDATRIDALEIRWPRTEAPQVFERPPLDSWLAVREGEPDYEVRPSRSFRF